MVGLFKRLWRKRQTVVVVHVHPASALTPEAVRKALRQELITRPARRF